MTGRDDFPADVVEEIRKRAGGRCSVPDCRAQTTGPSESRVSGVTNVGVAAHITAAAAGGPRFDPAMTAKDRRSRENGIWVCQTHGKMIDDDERRYMTDLLRAWRDRAEALAAAELGRPVIPGRKPGLVQHETAVAPGGERQGTADFVDDIGMRSVWGKQRSDLVRMVLYELALNAIRHGAATGVTLHSGSGSIALIYDGPAFGLNDLLRADPRGGGDAVRALRQAAAGLLELNYRYQDGSNEWFIVDLSRSGAAEDPCGVQLTPKGKADCFSSVADCDEIHVYVDDLWSFSDVHELAASIPEHLRGRQFVVYGIDPAGPLASRLRELLSCVRFADPDDLPQIQD
jgi:hypothetical protein